MFHRSKPIPTSTAFLVSALMIYPAFSAISVDLDKQALQIDFQFSLQPAEDVSKYEALVEKLKKALSFTYSLLKLSPMVHSLDYQHKESIFIVSWCRDLLTLSEEEVDICHDIVYTFHEDQRIELEYTFSDGEQFHHYEMIFDELFHQVQEETQHPIQLRAYRDMGMIYVHRIQTDA